MILPASLIVVGVVAPAIRWGQLPGSRPGALVLPMVIGLIGLVQLVREL